MAGRHRHRDTETSDYVAFTIRVISGFGDRIPKDPAALAHFRELETALRDHVNRGIFEANRGEAHYSRNEMAKILGVSDIAIMKRIRNGEIVYAMQQAARGAGALVRIGDIRRARANALAAAQVHDRTGSARERQAG
jgi:hypothetical protein